MYYTEEKVEGWKREIKNLQRSNWSLQFAPIFGFDYCEKLLTKNENRIRNIQKEIEEFQKIETLN
jgi:hypothetical protein